MKSKKGQAPGAAGLVAVIGIIILLYILFLPPADREALLSDEIYREKNDEVCEELGNLTILLRKPGSLDYLRMDEYRHNLQGFYLYSSIEANVLERIDSLQIKRSLFSKEFKTISFRVFDPPNTKNLMLSFSAPVRRGTLNIYLNGNLIASRLLRTQNPEPVILPDRYIEEHNKLEFHVSGPGALFWITNQINMENIKITADIADVSGLESRQFFYITQEEKRNLESARLRFIADCQISKVGPLDISLNNRIIYSSIPDCGMPNMLNIDVNNILEGENKIIFKSRKGNYDVYSVEIATKLEELLYPRYYFQITEEQYRRIEDDAIDVNLSLLFTNDVDLKYATIRVNNHEFEVYTRDMKYDRLIDRYIRQGNNVIEFSKLRTRLNIIELKIGIIKKD